MPDATAEVQRIMADVAEARCRGDQVSDADVLGRYPELADQLRAALPFAAMIAEAHRRSLDAASPCEQITLLTDEELDAPIDVVSLAPPPKLVGYDLAGEVGRGGQAVVYRGTHVATGLDVAVKVVHGGQRAGGNSAGRFRREIKILLRLRHPNVVGITDHGHTADGSLYLVMPFIVGLPLDDHAATLAGDDAAIARLFATVAEAVDAVHRAGVVHRDLKPSNVLVDAAGEPHVLDFGLAASAAAADLSRSLTGPGQILGSLPWASPEQARGEVESVDARSDVYAIGLMLCRAIAAGGCGPYAVDGPPHRTIDNILHARPHVAGRRLNDPLAAVALRCLAKRPDDRYPSAAALATDLRHVAAGRRPTGTGGLRYRWRGLRPSRGRFAVTALALVAAMIAGALAVHRVRLAATAGPTGRATLRAGTGYPTRRSRSGTMFAFVPAAGMGHFAWIAVTPADGASRFDFQTALKRCRAAGAVDGVTYRLPTTAEMSWAAGYRPDGGAGFGVSAAEWDAAGTDRPGPALRPFRLACDP